jgi:multisubunit Na+/H+ antiporter MnhB subunit
VTGKDFREGFPAPSLQLFQMAEETHTDFEIAIERELHGALPAPEAAQLAEHLLGCATCRAYQRTALEMETNMEAIGNLFSQGVVWGRVRGAVDERVSDEQSRFRLTVVAGLAGVLVFAIVLPLVKHQAPRLDLIALMAGAMGIGLFIAWRRIRKLTRTAKDAESSTEALFATLDQANRSHTRQALVGLASASVLGMVVFPDMVREHSPLLWGMVALYAWTVVDLVQRLVRLRRERAEMLRG